TWACASNAPPAAKSTIFEETMSKSLRYLVDGNGQPVFTPMKGYQDSEQLHKIQFPFHPNGLHTQQTQATYDVTVQQHYTNQLFNYNARIGAGHNSSQPMTYLPQPPPFPLPIYPVYNNNPTPPNNSAVGANYNRRIVHQQPAYN